MILLVQHDSEIIAALVLPNKADLEAVKRRVKEIKASYDAQEWDEPMGDGPEFVDLLVDSFTGVYPIYKAPHKVEL